MHGRRREHECKKGSKILKHIGVVSAAQRDHATQTCYSQYTTLHYTTKKHSFHNVQGIITTITIRATTIIPTTSLQYYTKNVQERACFELERAHATLPQSKDIIGESIPTNRLDYRKVILREKIVSLVINYVYLSCSCSVQ